MTEQSIAQTMNAEQRHERASLLARAARHEECKEALFSEALSALTDEGRWDEILEICQPPVKGSDPRELSRLRAHALSELGRADDAVSLLRERVAKYGIDLRDEVALLLSAKKIVIAARLIGTTSDNDVPFQVTEARRSVVAYCRYELSTSNAARDPLGFTEFVEALRELHPERPSLTEGVNRGCILLIRQARHAFSSGDIAGALVFAKRIAAVKTRPLTLSVDCADILFECGRLRDAILALYSGDHFDQSVLDRVVSILEQNSDWSGLWMPLASLRHAGLVGARLATVQRRIMAQIYEAPRDQGISNALDAALALAAISTDVTMHSEVVATVLSRSRRVIRTIGRENRPLLWSLCERHLRLQPGDRAVAHRYVKLMQVCGMYAEVREFLRALLRRDPHDERFWADLAACCTSLNLDNEATQAANRIKLITASAAFEAN